MRQTLLALAALLIAMLLSFNQKQATLNGQEQVVRAELEQMALGVARQATEMIRARAFDGATVGVPSDSVVATNNFTAPPFPSGTDCQAFGGGTPCTDLDDFHQMNTATMSFDFPSGGMDMTVDVTVRYVNANLQPTGGATSRRKQIIVRVQDAPSSTSPRLPEPIEYSAVVSYPRE